MALEHRDPSSTAPASFNGPAGPSGGFERLRRAVDERLAGLLGDEATRWSRLDDDLVHGYEVLRAFIGNGGKRLRPAFAYWAFVGSGGRPDDPGIIDLAAALEMLHTFALVHDDVMDGSDSRRHAPTVHRRLIDHHFDRQWRGEARRFGEGMAILLGDLALVYADGLVAALPADVRQCFQEMKVELHVGQYLDVWGAATGEMHPGRTATVVRYKTASYSVERPLRLGATLAGIPHAAPGTAGRTAAGRDRALSEFGLAVGEAYQLRDDLLGAFGDPAVTGKPSGDDLREGKQTLLVHLARAWAGSAGAPRHAATLLGRLGTPEFDDDDIEKVRDVLERSGARCEVERRIGNLTEAALAVLPVARLDAEATDALCDLARRAAWRAA